jgi:hypothetical protein
MTDVLPVSIVSGMKKQINTHVAQQVVAITTNLKFIDRHG